jgi:Icc-related predicted phosphoesterase
MRIVATSDTHFPFDNSLIPDGDVFIHCGDLMYSGYPDEWYARVESLKALPHKHKLLVPGNHDFHIQNYEGIARAELRRAGVKLLGMTTLLTEIGGIKFAAVPYVTGLNGWAFNKEEDELTTYLERLRINEVSPHIMMAHAPIYSVRDCVNPEQMSNIQNHVGSWAMNYWHSKMMPPPLHWFHGHIHQSYGSEEHGGTMFHNVAMCDRDYEQVNPAIVVDL